MDERKHRTCPKEIAGLALKIKHKFELLGGGYVSFYDIVESLDENQRGELLRAWINSGETSGEPSAEASAAPDH